MSQFHTILSYFPSYKRPFKGRRKFSIKPNGFYSSLIQHYDLQIIKKALTDNYV